MNEEQIQAMSEKQFSWPKEKPLPLTVRHNRAVYLMALHDHYLPLLRENGRLKDAGDDLLNRMNDLCAFVAANANGKMLDEFIEKYPPTELNRAWLKARALSTSPTPTEHEG